ncbi:hypothetical protein Pla86_12520 [Planctomycetes bacterium Pla86]|uniref:Uncharacterized protein n=1 Tax=Engelhardtia mirabilis TaxID=2528011 RepID=A0A518BGU7_9BACT|nr:hypothetical protein Pla133_12520 [Planctomycetes bacterium Pla133]QDV00513.1 hypothetical protein Pla86_12520 [Planctomycetes bacterium Pla86]
MRSGSGLNLLFDRDLKALDYAVASPREAAAEIAVRPQPRGRRGATAMRHLLDAEPRPRASA